MGVLLIGAVMYLALTVQNGLPGERYYILHAELADAGNLDTYDDVRIAGRDIGQVSAISYSGQDAHVTLQIEPGDAPIRQGSTIRIRLNGLIGDKFVQITPALRGPELPSGATIGLSATTTAPDLFDVLSGFRNRQISDLRATIRGLGEGFIGRGDDLNAAIGDSPALLRAARPLLKTLNANPAADRRLLPALDALADAVAPARFNIAGGFAPEAASLQPLAAHASSLAATLAQAPGVETTASQQLPVIDGLLAQTDGLASALRRLTRPAPAAFAATSALLRDAETPIRDATGLLRDAIPLVPVALRLTNRVNPLAAPLAQLFEDSIPLVTQIGLRTCDLIKAANWLRQAASYGQLPDGTLGPHNVVRVLEATNSDTVEGGPKLPSGLIATDSDPAPCTAFTEVIPSS
jgi:ABC-type transporter Mla subunit MlaD